RHRELTAHGIGLVALSYRGYMGSTGHPTEAGLLQDAEAAYRFATSHYPSSPVVLWGHSLGSGVAGGPGGPAVRAPLLPGAAVVLSGRCWRCAISICAGPLADARPVSVGPTH